MNTRHLLYTLVLVLVTAIGLSAQDVIQRADLDSKMQKRYEKAIKEMREKKYDKSISNMDKILKKYPTFIDAILRKSGIYYNLGKLDDALAALDQSIAIDPDYDPEVYFSKGVIYRQRKEYHLAAKSFATYIEKEPKSDKLEKAIIYQAQTAFADKAIKNPVPYQPRKLMGDVNTGSSEYIPALTIDEEQMIFTRRVRGQEDLYIASLVDGKYTAVREIADLNTPGNEGVHTISADGTKIIFTACDRGRLSLGGCDLFRAYITEDGWSVPSNMGKLINSTGWDAQPSLSADGNTLYWSSNRKYGKGGNDIWVSKRTNESGWSVPESMSEHVNTKYNEESPFIHPDGKTLYFRSNRPTGMGDYDIYYTRYNDSTGMWSPATNIGYPINTEESEGAMSVSLDGTKAFFATSQNTGQDGTLKNLDIYTFELYPEARPHPVTYIKAKVTDADTGEPLVATIKIVQLPEESTAKKTTTSTNGTYLGGLLTGYDYACFVTAEGYTYHSEHFALDRTTTVFEPYRLNIQLHRVKPTVATTPTDTPVEEPVVMNNIFFVVGSAELTPSSDAEVSQLAEALRTNPGMNVEIAGHTDNVGSKADNQKLSEERAKSVVNSLVAKGIAKTRLTYKGYGETKPIASNETPEGRAKNRRTEFRITN